MVPWASLSESRAKNRAGVVDSLSLLATLGYRSFDEPDAQWQSFRRKGEVTAVQRDEAGTGSARGATRCAGEPVTGR